MLIWFTATNLFAGPDLEGPLQPGGLYNQGASTCLVTFYFLVFYWRLPRGLHMSKSGPAYFWRKSKSKGFVMWSFTGER